jgi:DNA-directed RNA polymerase specialized sigma24 family protein
MIDQRLDRVVRKRVDASDIVQDVLVEANRRLGTYLTNPTMPFQLWLRHMAHDRVIDAHRRHRVAGSRSLDKEVSLDAPVDSDQSQTNLAQKIADTELTPAAVAHGMNSSDVSLRLLKTLKKQIVRSFCCVISNICRQRMSQKLSVSRNLQRV